MVATIPYHNKRREMELALDYHNMVPENVRFSGRVSYKRYMVDIDDCIEQALHFSHWLKGGASYEGHSVLMKKMARICIT